MIKEKMGCFLDKNNLKKELIIMIFAGVIGLASPASAEIMFEDVSENAGISYIGSSWGASWGDFNGDGLPDLWSNGHHLIPNLYVNNGDGTFSDIPLKLDLNSPLGKDRHGAAWADFDNDGDQDIIVLTGAGRGLGHGPNFFLVNEEGVFQDKAAELGLDYPLGRGRTPLWFDYDNDGLLDVLLANNARPDKQAPTSLFLQKLAGFEDVIESPELLGAWSIWPFDSTTSVGSAQISDLSRDNKMDLVIMVPFSIGVFDLNNLPIQNIKNNLNVPDIWSRDFITGDFNGDLHPDIFLSRMDAATSIAIQDDTNTIKSHLSVRNDEQGFSFKTLGKVTVDLYVFGIEDYDVFVGSQGFDPKQNSFTLSPDDESVLGIFNHWPGIDTGFYIGYDSSSQIWNVLHSSSEQTTSNIVVSTEKEILDFTPIGSEISQVFQEDKLLVNTNEGFVDTSNISGFSDSTACRSAVAGDFDNDMDLDIYLVCTLQVKNIPNILYENNGDGTFFKVTDSGGAEASELGIGDSVSTVDYDGDGFLDLFVTNGLDLRPFSDDGPSQLFRNLGNENHWIEIDLKGTISNSDGIGSRIQLTTGNVTQLREQTGGMHFASQNHQRIHIGLGQNNIIDSIVVFWPSGIVHELENVAVDQILNIMEPNSPLSFISTLSDKSRN